MNCGLRWRGIVTISSLLSLVPRTALTQDQNVSELLNRLSSPLDVTAPAGENAARARNARASARSLVLLPRTALPYLEAALDSVESHGEASEFASNLGWLLDVYALLRGPAAMPRLVSLSKKPELNPMGLRTFEFDNAIALALNLTFYVSATRTPTLYFPGHEPRTDFDQFLLAWMRNDRVWIDAKLGPTARGTMSLMLEGKTWEDFRNEFWPTGSEAVGIGFRFLAAGRWSRPADNLDDELLEQRRTGTDLLTLGKRFIFPTVFTNSLGIVCGSRPITFVEGPAPFDYGDYQVDNVDLADLFRLLTSCAVKR